MKKNEYNKVDISEKRRDVTKEKGTILLGDILEG